jgi:sugar transferase (PEP-CTERM/EpsH1 system associated)
LLRGDRVRAHYQLNHLGRRHRVTLLTPISDSREAQNLRTVASLCERVITVPIAPWQRFRNLCGAAFSNLPWQVSYWYHPAIGRALQQAHAQAEFDLIHVQLVRMAPAVFTLAGPAQVLDFIDSLSLNFHRRAELQAGVIGLGLRHEAKRLRDYEKRVATLYDETFISSPIDRNYISADRNIHVVPNGVDLASFPFHPNDRDPNLIIFSGRMGYFPNADGAVWFTSEVLPLIRREYPSVRFLIAGADPPVRVRRLQNVPGVEVTGYVSDLAACVHRGAIAVSPLQSGSGMQFKLLEAMASGTPSVVTPYSLGGIDAQHGKHLLVATGAEDFAAATVRLMSDNGLRARICRAARDLVQSRYTWESSLAKTEEIYSLAIDKCRQRSSNRS